MPPQRDCLSTRGELCQYVTRDESGKPFCRLSGLSTVLARANGTCEDVPEHNSAQKQHLGRYAPKPIVTRSAPLRLYSLRSLPSTR